MRDAGPRLQLGVARPVPGYWTFGLISSITHWA